MARTQAPSAGRTVSRGSRWKRAVVIATAASAAGCTTGRPPPASPPRSRYTVDHLVVGVADLDGGIREIQRLTGVAPERGGAHPAGTQNALWSLGPRTYLELVAPAPSPPAGNPLVGFLATLQQPTPIGWAVGTDSLDAARAEVVRGGSQLSPSEPGSRTRPDGTELRWQTARLGGPAHSDVAPFFIQWDADRPHPAATSPAGCTLERFALGAPTPDALVALLTAMEIHVPVRATPEPAIEITLRCPTGSVVLGPPPTAP